MPPTYAPRRVPTAAIVFEAQRGVLLEVTGAATDIWLPVQTSGRPGGIRPQQPTLGRLGRCAPGEYRRTRRGRLGHRPGNFICTADTPISLWVAMPAHIDSLARRPPQSTLPSGYCHSAADTHHGRPRGGVGGRGYRAYRHINGRSRGDGAAVPPLGGRVR